MQPHATIPVLDLSPQIEALWGEVNEAIQRVLRSGSFIQGEEVRTFEQEAASYLGAEHAIGVNSGTDALVLALHALGIQHGDEVITTPFSFFATAESIWQVGAIPVFVDIELDSMNIDPTRIEAAISARTKAIIPVHLFGRPVVMKQVMTLAERYGLKVIEDCAQAFGAKCETMAKYVGSIGDVGAFSFYPTKNLGAFGDGGLVTTNDAEVAQRVRMLQNHGASKKYHHELLGYNSRLDEMQAAILRVKLPHIDTWNRLRRQVAERYNALLRGVEWLKLPQVTQGHVFHQYTVQIAEDKRDLVKAQLQEKNIQTNIYYPVPQHHFLQDAHPSIIRDVEVSERMARQVLSLPMWPELRHEEQVHVARELLKIVST